MCDDSKAMKKNTDSALCAWCGQPLPPRHSHMGHPRWYCSAACREKAYRQRRDRKAEALAEFDELAPRVPPTDQQIALTILEARSAAVAFARLGLEARPRLAERCAAAGAAIHKAIDGYFPGV